ncbi:unnamed protein product [marine sediment metagenome]|uniref:YdhG-like domain-containing protein n=1 Tax=marine sediment metagenome TaxID=412755 RepID=X1T9K3_9ZZZZ
MQFDVDMASPNKDLFMKVRELLLSYQGMTETRKQRITTYSCGKGGICHMRTMPHGIDIGFLKGAKMLDQHARLKGNGKAMRILPLVEAEVEIIDYYICQAIEFIK